MGQSEMSLDDDRLPFFNAIQDFCIVLIFKAHINISPFSQPFLYDKGQFPPASDEDCILGNKQFVFMNFSCDLNLHACPA